jgi:hypothetical protein
MNKVISKLLLLLPASIMPVLYYLYDLLNRNYLVRRFGCGCHDGFNTNVITRWFWAGTAIVAIAVSVFTSKPLVKWYFRALYVAAVAICCTFMATLFIKNMLWV